MDERLWQVMMTYQARPDQLYLALGVVDPGLFIRGGTVSSVGDVIRLEVLQDGIVLPLLWGHPSTPVVTPAVGARLHEYAPADIQRFPARIDGSDDEYEVVNVVAIEDCVLEQQGPSNYIRLDPRRISHRVFRPKGAISVVVVTEEIKEALEAEGVEGFRLVSYVPLAGLSRGHGIT